MRNMITYLPFVVLLAVKAQADPTNMVWPKPAKVEYGTDSICLTAAEWTFELQGACAPSSPISLISSFTNLFNQEQAQENRQVEIQSCNNLKEATQRYTQFMFSHNGNNGKNLKQGGCIGKASVFIEDAGEELGFGTDESYHLAVTSAGIQIHAKTIFGAYHGLESLSQLVRFKYAEKDYVIENAPWKIDDVPRFAHRELLVDSSRHFLPLRTLERIIDSMTFSKANVMHWHLEDDQAFPYCSERFPKLCTYGAYTNQEMYTKEDLKYIVQYAHSRGIRVMPELDIPGHTQAICRGYPEACVSAGTMISPAQKMSNEIIKGLLEEMAEIFPDSFVHLGGDEVNLGRWNDDKDTKAMMEKMNITATDVYLGFVEFSHQVALSLGKTPVGWGEIWQYFRTKLNSRSVMEKWRDQDDLKDITSNKYQVIYANSRTWYLDHLDVMWEAMYKTEPCGGLTDEMCTYVIGGGGEMWGETVDTGDILNTIWPRYAAILERLWSPREVNDVNDAKSRLFQFRCHIHRRGYSAGPLLLSGRASPHGPGSCFVQ